MNLTSPARSQGSLYAVFALICCISTSLHGYFQDRTDCMVLTQRPLNSHSFIYKLLPGPCCCGPRTSLDVVALKSKSIWDPSNARFFLFDCKNELLIVQEDAPALVYEKRDIDATWFPLLQGSEGFYTNMSLRPKSSMCGGRLKGQLAVGDLLPIPFFKNVFFGISTGFAHTKNYLELRTGGLSCSLSPVDIHSLVQRTFDDPSWGAAKVCPGCLKRTSVTDITLTYGSTLIRECELDIEYFSSVVIPTDKKREPDYLFSPQTGPNKHFGIETGFYINAPILTCEGSSPSVVISLSNIFYLRNRQCRTFDLLDPISNTSGGDNAVRGDRPYSRYLPMRRKGETGTVPGVNVLTVPCRVRPSNIAEVTGALAYRGGPVTVFVGYNLWTHPGEKVCLHTPRCAPYHLKAEHIYEFEEYGIAGDTAETSASRSTIRERADNDTEFTTIKQTDLNLNSAQAPSGTLHTAFGTIELAHRSHAISALFGGFYSIPHSNSSLRTWGIHFTIHGEF